MTIFSNFRDQLHLAQCFNTNTTRMLMASTCMDQPQGSFDKKNPVKCTLMTPISLLVILKPPNQLYCLLSGPFHLRESALMEKGLHLCKTLSVFCCRSPCKTHKIQVQSCIDVPTVVPTPTLDLEL